MLAQMRCSLPILCAFLLVMLPADAAEPSFADLLARAQAQAAADHRWNPPGDNFVETLVIYSVYARTRKTEALNFSISAALSDSDFRVLA